jgi:hypothetical protein
MPTILRHALDSNDKVYGCPSRAGNAATKACCVCLDALLTDTATTTFDCADTFHTQCLAEVMNFDVKTAKEACPMCQLPVSDGPEKIFMEASQRYSVVHRSVEEGQSSWSDLPISLQNDLDAAIVGWHLTAEMGFVKAQHNLAVMYEKGRGVAQSDAEAARWFLKAAEQGHARAQCKLDEIYSEGKGDSPRHNIQSVSRWRETMASQLKSTMKRQCRGTKRQATKDI